MTRSETFATASYDGTAKVWSVNVNPRLQILSASEGSTLKFPPRHNVHRAFYGHPDWPWVAKWGKNVTEKVQWLARGSWTADADTKFWIRKDPDDLLVNAYMFGDPLPDAPETRKMLFVEVSPIEETSTCLLNLDFSSIDIGWYGEGGIMSIVFSRAGDTVLTAAYDGSACIWCSTTGECKKRFKAEKEEFPGLYTAQFSADESRVLTASASGVARLWRIEDGFCEWKLQGHEDMYMRYATFSPDGRRLATASADTTARLWLLDAVGEQPRLERTLRGHTGWVNTAIFSADSSVLLTSAADKTARLWCTGTGTLLRTFRGHKHFVRTAVFSPDLTRVLTSCFDWTAKLWSADKDEAAHTFIGHEGPCNSAFFSTDGALVITTSRDETARLWCPVTGVCFYIVRGHKKFVVWAVFAEMESQVKLALVKSAAEQWAEEPSSAVADKQIHDAADRKWIDYVAEKAKGKWIDYAADLKLEVVVPKAEQMSSAVAVQAKKPWIDYAADVKLEVVVPKAKDEVDNLSQHKRCQDVGFVQSQKRSRSRSSSDSRKMAKARLLSCCSTRRVAGVD